MSDKEVFGKKYWVHFLLFVVAGIFAWGFSVLVFAGMSNVSEFERFRSVNALLGPFSFVVVFVTSSLLQKFLSIDEKWVKQLKRIPYWYSTISIVLGMTITN